MTKDKLIVIGGMCLIGIVMIAFIYGLYQAKRSWNYSWAYEERVEQSVCKIVKPEYLTNYGIKTCK